MSENLINAEFFQPCHVYSTIQDSPGIINNNGGTGIVAHLDIPVTGTYLVHVTGWDYQLSDGDRLENGHLSLVYNDHVFAQQGITNYTFNITAYKWMDKNSTVNLVLTNWDKSSLNTATSKMANFKFEAIRIGL